MQRCFTSLILFLVVPLVKPAVGVTVSHKTVTFISGMLSLCQTCQKCSTFFPTCVVGVVKVHLDFKAVFLCFLVSPLYNVFEAYP